MLCDKCHKREAKIYYTEIVDGEKKEQYLCEECAAKYTSFPMKKSELDNSLGGLLSSILSNYYDYCAGKTETPQKPEAVVKCPTCGISYEEIRKTGKLGCADCYQHFSNAIERTLRQIQGADTHIGKIPTPKEGKKKVKVEVPKEKTIKEKIELLSIQLQKAVECEAFEEAARLRDEIYSLKKEAAKDA